MFKKKRFYYTIDEFSPEQINTLAKHLETLTVGYWETIAYEKCYEAIGKLEGVPIRLGDNIELKFTLNINAEFIIAVLGVLKLPAINKAGVKRIQGA